MSAIGAGTKWHAALAFAVAACVTGLSFGYAATVASHPVVLAVALSAGGGVLWLLPTRWLLPLSLATVLALPTENLAVPGAIASIPVGVLPAVVWLTKARKEPNPAVIVLLGWLFLGATAVSLAFSEFHTGGAVSAAVALALPALMAVTGARPEPGQTIGGALLMALPALGLFGLVEKFVWEANPVYGAFYTHSHDGGLQVWSSYRATTLMGFPLVNGTVFAVGTVFALGRLLRLEGNRGGDTIRLALIAGGLVATVSRGAIVGAGAGVIVLLAATVFRSPRHVGEVRGRVLALVAVCVATVCFAGPIAARSDSSEGQASAEVRAQVVSLTRTAVSGHGLVGVGPAQAENHRLKHGLPGDLTFTSGVGFAVLQLENAYAQLLVDVGYPGFAIYVTLLISVIAVGVGRRRSVVPASALVAFGVAIAGYNALDAHPQMNLLAGLLFLDVLGAPLEPSLDDADERMENRERLHL